MRKRPNPAAWGVADHYRGSARRRVEVSREAIEAVLQAMGAEEESPPSEDSVLVVRAGERPPIEGAFEIHTEEGDSRRAGDRLPADLPIGYHVLERRGRHTRLIVAPRRCYLPDDLRTWGWALGLYALRSHDSWGMGDLADLREMGRWAAHRGAGMLAINPLHAVAPTLPQEASPYFPSSRVFRNPLYLRVEEIPGGDDPDLAALGERGRALNAHRLIDRDEVFRLKYSAFEKAWERFEGDAGFDEFRLRGGKALESFAVHCADTEQRDRDRSTRRDDRVRFHQWLQWLTARQLEEAGREIPLVGDLAIGVDPLGAEPRMWPDVFVAGVTAGAPPDRFNTRGQNWGLAVFDPHRLRRAAYEPFITTLRAAFHGAGGLRIDHVMWMFRLFWIPDGGGPRDGAYVRYPADDLLAILALESHRARAIVIGEDLGTVEAGVRARLRSQHVLAQRLLFSARGTPDSYPRTSMASSTTHDLPTLPGLWSGADLEAQQAMKTAPNLRGVAAARRRLVRMTGLDADAPTEALVTRAYELLASSPSAIAAAALEDALGVEERPNMPGTTDEWPNWRLALPHPLEEIREHPGAARVADILSERVKPR